MSAMLALEWSPCPGRRGWTGGSTGPLQEGGRSRRRSFDLQQSPGGRAGWRWGRGCGCLIDRRTLERWREREEEDKKGKQSRTQRLVYQFNIYFISHLSLIHPPRLHPASTSLPPPPTCMAAVCRLQIGTPGPQSTPLSSLVSSHASLPLHVISQSVVLKLSQVGPGSGILQRPAPDSIGLQLKHPPTLCHAGI